MVVHCVVTGHLCRQLYQIVIIYLNRTVDRSTRPPLCVLMRPLSSVTMKRFLQIWRWRLGLNAVEKWKKYVPWNLYQWKRGSSVEYIVRKVLQNNLIVNVLFDKFIEFVTFRVLYK